MWTEGAHYSLDEFMDGLMYHWMYEGWNSESWTASIGCFLIILLVFSSLLMVVMAGLYLFLLWFRN